MLNSLYQESLNKKGILNELLEEYSIKNIDVSKHWKNQEFKKINHDFVIAGGDGSKHEKKFLSFYFYAVASKSLIYDGNLKEIESSTINLMNHSKFAKDRIRNYMGIFEVKSALKTIKKYDIDYYFYDGSILGDLIRPFPIEKEISKEKRSKILNLLYNKINNDIDKGDILISTSNTSNIINDKLNKEFEENKDNSLVFLENIEKLLVLSKLLKYNKKIIAISKTSTASDIFESNIPDMAIFNSYSKKSGHSKEFNKELSKEIKHDFPVEHAFFRSLTFTIFYLRIEENKNILKVELPYKANDEEISKIISIIFENSVEGYPYILKKAHHDVIIKKKDMEQLSLIIGLNEKTGREML
ncbi:DNA double-strand break repair nuclease NurA [Methanobrevibacter filiformis]|uniref:NurA domain protein n=1 Tax=Methanobrevibacter filiformis TaxID=55758 RepID=A0A166DLL3_9EURY|nr:DNA double-strand break repair nuclease NurA [Methanobrevibacter filiformis]KZX15726.1 NurA domain protein [Methanobrevibacter filiformis]